MVGRDNDDDETLWLCNFLKEKKNKKIISHFIVGVYFHILIQRKMITCSRNKYLTLIHAKKKKKKEKRNPINSNSPVIYLFQR